MKLDAKDLKALYDRLHEHLWEGDEKRSPARRVAMRVVRLTIAVLRDMGEGRFPERAASISYTTLLSFAPLLAVMFSVLKGLGVQDALAPMLTSFLKPLGPSAPDITAHIVDFVGHIQMSVLGAVGVVLLLWGVLAMMRKIEQSFNEIWRLQDRRSLFQRIRDYLGVLMIGPFLLFMSMAMTAAIRNANVVASWLHIDLENGHLGFIFNSVPYLLFMLAFTALYMFMPNTKVNAAPALMAGLLTGIIWKILGKLFALFVTGASNYAAIYSAFAAMVLFMIWIYVGWMTVLAGAAICYYLQHPSNQSISRRFRSLSARMKEKLALQICVEIGQALYQRRPPLDVTQLSARIGVPSLAVDNVVRSLTQMGILAHTGRDGQAFIPARPFDETSVEDMLTALRAADESGVLQAHKLRGAPSVNNIVKIYDKAIHRDLGKITLKQLALGSTET